MGRKSASSFDIAAEISKGWHFNSPKEGEWNVVSPDGRHGSGGTAEEAMANVDSHILPAPTAESRFRSEVMSGTSRYYNGRVRIRADGEELALDRWQFQPIEGEPGWIAPPAAPVPEDTEVDLPADV